jgi:FkbM family methyltransferase
MTIVRAAFDAMRRARLRALLTHRLTNAGDVWRAYRAGTDVPTLKFRDGGTLYHGRGDSPVFLFFEIFANGCYRRQLRHPPRGRIVDIGANIGAFTIDCGQRFPDVHIDAYEPNPVALRLLERNVTANRLTNRVRIYNEAVGAASGVVRLWPADGNITATLYPSPTEIAATPIDVRVTDLATVVDRAGPVGVLKIDAEGAEADIIEGGRAALRHVDQIVAEYHEARIPGVLRRLEAVLHEQGFVSTVSRDRRCGPLVYASRP